MSKLSIMLFFVFTIQTNGVNAQIDSIRLDDLEKRVKFLEDYKSNIENISKIEIGKAKDEILGEVDDDYKNVRMLFAFILALGIPTTAYGIYLMFWGINKKAKKIIDERIETIVEQKREDLIKLIKNQEFEGSLRNTKKILVISASEEAQEEIKRTMSRFKFKHLIFRVNKTFANMPEHDLIIFNDCDGELSQPDINEIITMVSDEDACFVAYTSKRLERDPRLNFANSKFTLYHSTLTTLSFTESIKREEGLLL